jgi:hypothetical protein
VLARATLAALPSTRAIPDRDVFSVTHPIRSIETRFAPRVDSCAPAHLKLVRVPSSLAATLAALPSMSLLPEEAPFDLSVMPSMSRHPCTLHSSDGNNGSDFDQRRLGLVGDQLAQERNQHDERNTDPEAT